MREEKEKEKAISTRSRVAAELRSGAKVDLSGFAEAKHEREKET